MNRHVQEFVTKPTLSLHDIVGAGYKLARVEYASRDITSIVHTVLVTDKLFQMKPECLSHLEVSPPAPEQSRPLLSASQPHSRNLLDTSQ